MTDATGPVTPPAEGLAAALADQESGWTSGRPIPLEDLLRLHPAVATAPDAVLEVVYNEAILRERHGRDVDLPDLQRRFPDIAPQLDIQWRVDQALVSRRPEPSTRQTDYQPPTGSPTPPRQIGRYRIDRALGTGGMGEVYRAWDPALERTLALKTVRGGTHSAETLARFRTEATAIAQLRHPHVVQVFDVGDADGLPFFAMEYCAGGTLADRLNRGPLPPTEAAAAVAQVGRGVAAAHARNVLHRDLKPSNVLLWWELDPVPAADGGSTQVEVFAANPTGGPSLGGTPVYKVSDFGLAKDLTGTSGQTESGVILGTPNYMPPEQAFGRAKHLGPTADVYAVGAILYECLTGRPPFRGATLADTLAQVHHQEPVPVRRLQPSVPLDLETVCLKCLEKDPARRYPTAAEVVADLDRFLAGRPVLAHPVGRLERAWRWARRNRLAASLGATAAAAIVAAAAVGLGLSIALTAALEVAEQDRDRARESERQTRAHLAASHAAAARLALQRGNGRAAIERLDEAAAAGLDTPALRLERVKAYCTVHEVGRALDEARSLSARDDLGELAGEVFLWRADLELDTHSVELDDGLRQVRRAVDRGLSAADRHYADGLLAETVPEAVGHFRRAVHADPTNPRTNTMLAMLLVLSGRSDEARERLLAAELLFPDHPAFATIHATLDAFLERPDAVRQRLAGLRRQLGDRQYAQAESAVRFSQELTQFARDLEKVQCGDPDASPFATGMSFQRALLRAQSAASQGGRDIYLPFPPGLLHAFRELTRAIPAGVAALVPGNRKALAGVFEQLAGLQPDAFYFLVAGTQRATLGSTEELRAACELFRRAAEGTSFLPIRRMSLFGAAVAESNLARDLPDADREEHRSQALGYIARLAEVGVSAEQGYKISLHCERLTAPPELAWRVIASWERVAPLDHRLPLARAKTHLRSHSYLSAIRLADAALERKDDAEWRALRKQAEEDWKRQSTGFFGGKK